MKSVSIVNFKLMGGEAHRIVIESQDRADGTVGAKTVESLLMTTDLDDFRVKLWNQGIDMLESMMIVQVCHGVEITNPGYVAGVRCYVQSLANRLGL